MLAACTWLICVSATFAIIRGLGGAQMIWMSFKDAALKARPKTSQSERGRDLPASSNLAKRLEGGAFTAAVWLAKQIARYQTDSDDTIRQYA